MDQCQPVTMSDGITVRVQGDTDKWTDEDRQWKHVVCPDAPLEREHPVCQTCWLTHPEGACDR